MDNQTEDYEPLQAILEFKFSCESTYVGGLSLPETAVPSPPPRTAPLSLTKFLNLAKLQPVRHGAYGCYP